MSAKESYLFEIVAKAEMRTLVQMAKKHHAEFDVPQLKNYLQNLLNYSMEKELETISCAPTKP